MFWFADCAIKNACISLLKYQIIAVQNDEKYCVTSVMWLQSA